MAADEQHVGLDADLAQLAHRVLRGLGLRLAHVDHGDEGEVHEQHVLAPDVVDELPGRLEERDGLDVADRAADLDHGDVHPGLLADPEDARLDLVGDVGDDLHGLAEEPALALARDDGLVDLAGGDRVVAAEGARGEAAVVSEVEVRLGPVVGDVDLAVLERVHGPRVHVEVGVDLDHADFVAAVLEEARDRTRRHSLAEAGADAARNEDVSAHGDSIIAGKGEEGQRGKLSPVNTQQKCPTRYLNRNVLVAMTPGIPRSPSAREHLLPSGHRTATPRRGSPSP